MVFSLSRVASYKRRIPVFVMDGRIFLCRGKVKLKCKSQVPFFRREIPAWRERSPEALACRPGSDGNHRGGKAAPKRDEVTQILEEGHILGVMVCQSCGEERGSRVLKGSSDVRSEARKLTERRAVSKLWRGLPRQVPSGDREFRRSFS